MKRGSSEDLLYRIIFLILVALFLGVLFYFMAGAFSGALTLEKSYAKQIALIIDSAEPGAEFSINFEKGNYLARARGIEPEISIIGNKVNVKLSNGKGYSYDFFNDVKAELTYKDRSKYYLKLSVANREFDPNLLAQQSSVEVPSASEVQADESVFKLGAGNKAYGTGFFVNSEDGIKIVSAWHVAEKSLYEFYYIEDGGDLDNGILIGNIEKYNQEKDSVLIDNGRISGKALELGNSRDLQVGNDVYILGTPEYSTTISRIDGKITGVGNVNVIIGEQGIEKEMYIISTSIPINEGYSGSPLFKEDKVVGMVFGKQRDTNRAYAIPINDIKSDFKLKDD
ncbi:MAG: serine protease [archaeon]